MKTSLDIFAIVGVSFILRDARSNVGDSFPSMHDGGPADLI